MSSLINDLIDFTRTRLGAGMPIHASTCHLRTVCEDAIESARAANPASEFLLTIDAEPRLLGDGPRLQQVFSNLLNNAVQHGDRGKPVLVWAFVDGRQAVIAITNVGSPISPKAIESVFEPLVQAGEPAAAHDERTQTSMGLGLFIVRESVRGHEGEISVTSSAAAGTTFTMRLPLPEVEGLA